MIDGKIVNSIKQIPELVDKNKSFIPIEANGKTYFSEPAQLIQAVEKDIGGILAIIDSPAFRESLSGVILEVDGIKITGFDKLKELFETKSPGDIVIIKTMQTNKEIKEYAIELAERDGRAFLGIGIAPPQTRGLLGMVYEFIAKIKDPFVYYESSLGDFGYFIYHLLWWTVLICLSVALVNMLPLGIFDGGRFFYLTVWGITGSKKIGEAAFKASTYLFLLLLAALMIKWVFIFV